MYKCAFADMHSQARCAKTQNMSLTLARTQHHLIDRIHLHAVCETEPTVRLTRFADIDCRSDDAPDGTLALSLAWNTHHGHAAVSMSDGSVSIARLSPTGFALETAWHAHDLEAWICAYDTHHASVLYTGADDAKFKMWDVRHAGEAATQTRANSRTHTAGVCSIQGHPTREFCVATGSYDEYVRVWDTRNFKAPVNETCIGGGVWRLKWHPSGSDRLLCAAMHNQFAVLDWDTDKPDGARSVGGDDFSVAPTVREYTGGHTSLGYGVDWMQHGDTNVVGSASFYDHRFEVWRITSGLAHDVPLDDK
eukprot:m.168669 g.168669  ORF g.168669 m.168669 type:complete len:307 (-) comp18216_c0_seq3:109-1029(-)